MKGIFITSNNTDSGKTFIACQIICALTQHNIKVSVRKPIETDCLERDGKLIAKDSLLLQNSANNQENIDTICPYKLRGFMSGELASTHQNITPGNLIKSCQSDNFVVVEGAGGFYSPLIKNTLNSDLAQKLNLPVVIVIEDKIGCISEALLTIEAVKNQGLKIVCVVLNMITKNNLENKINLAKYTSEKIIECRKNALFQEEMHNLIMQQIHC